MKPLFRHPDSWKETSPDRDGVQAWQLDSLDAAERQGFKSVLVQAPMGVGKTVLATKRAKIAEKRGRRVVFLCHLTTLVEQAYRTFIEWGVDAQIEQAQSKAKHVFGRPPHIIASKDSLRPDRLADLIRRTRLDTVETEVAVDECHLAASESFLRPIRGFRPVFTYGLSGTPVRLDGRPLTGHGAPFDALCCRYDFLTACRHGNLVPPLFAECVGSINLKDIKLTRQAQGLDYDRAALTLRINENLGHVCRAAKEQMQLWGVTRALAFLPDIGTARAAEAMWSGLGYRCRAIYGEMSDSDKTHIKGAYHRGDLDILTSCQMLDVGFDDPPTDCVIMATPTKSPVKALQQGGRGSRLFTGKNRYVAIGFKWESDDEGPQSTLDLLLRGVPDDDVRRRAGALLRAHRGRNFLEAVEAAEIEVAEERAEERRRRQDLPVSCVDRPAHYTLKVHDPLEMASGSLDKITRSQLRQCGLEPHEINAMSAGQADRFLEEWFHLRPEGMSTYRQVARLVQWGMDRLEAMSLTMQQARGAIYSMRKKW